MRLFFWRPRRIENRTAQIAGEVLADILGQHELLMFNQTIGPLLMEATRTGAVFAGSSDHLRLAAAHALCESSLLREVRGTFGGWLFEVTDLGRSRCHSLFPNSR
jgi:hypothetical protein